MIAAVLPTVAALTTSSCGAPSTSVGPPHQTTTVPRLERAASARRSWMPAGARKGRLLYVSDDEQDTVFVFKAPFGNGNGPGRLTGFRQPMGMCTDNHDNVWITDLQAHAVVEYARGAIDPTRTLSAPDDQEVLGCAVDPRSGDLAVTSVGTANGDYGNVYVFHHAEGNPVVYSDSNVTAYFDCSYDDAGNLFIDGQYQATFPDQNRYVELLKGAAALTDVSMLPSIDYPGGVRWHGSYFALIDVGSQVVHHLQINDGVTSDVGTTTLSGSSNIANFAIYDNKLVGSDGDDREVQRFEYPSGGDPVKTIGSHVLYSPVGIVVSLPPNT